MSRHTQPTFTSPLTLLLLKFWQLISYGFLGFRRSPSEIRRTSQDNQIIYYVGDRHVESKFTDVHDVGISLASQ